MDYGYILRRAWQMTRHQRVLWLFGLLASLGLPGQFGVGWQDLPPEAQRWIADAVYGDYFVPIIVGLVLLTLLFLLASAVLNSIGRAGLVSQANRIENGRAPTLRTGWMVGKAHLWSVLLLHLLLGLPIYGLILLGFIPYILKAYVFYLPPGPGVDPATIVEATGRFFACFLPALFLAIPLVIPANVLRRLAIRACMLEGRSILPSILRGWGILRQHVAEVALLWLLLAIISIGALLTIGIPIGLSILLLFALYLTLLYSASTTALVLMIVASLFFFLLGLVVKSGIEILLSTSWTIAYRNLTGLGLTGEEPPSSGNVPGGGLPT